MFTDDVEISPVSHTIPTRSNVNLHSTKKENLTESTGVVPAKYPPKVKSENILTTLEC